nr:beta-D-glucosyl crocetin beta-1,6-glucosyltransferase-like [Lolium perenne]
MAQAERERMSVTDRINLVSLHLPSSSLPDLPPALHTTKRLPARLMPALKRACNLAAPRPGALRARRPPPAPGRPPLRLLRPSPPERARVPAVHLSTCSAAATAFFAHRLQNERVPRAFPFEAISLGGPDEDAKYTALLAIR